VGGDITLGCRLRGQVDEAERIGALGFGVHVDEDYRAGAGAGVGERLDPGGLDVADPTARTMKEKIMDNEEEHLEEMKTPLESLGKR